MQVINIEPGSVFDAAGKLHTAANKIGDGRIKAKSALSNTGGLPPQFRDRASGLANRAAGLFAMDMIAVAGVELTTRGRLALGYDGAGTLGLNGPLPNKKLLAFSENLKLWNRQTRDRAAARPGAYLNEINKVLGKPAASKAPPPKAGSGGCKLYRKNGDFLRFEIKGKQDMTPKQQQDAIKERKRLMKRYLAMRSPNGKLPPSQVAKQRGEILRDLSKLSGMGKKELSVYLGYYGAVEGGGKCLVSLGNGYDAQGQADLRGQLKIGGTAKLSKDQIKLDAGFDASLKAEIRASAGNGNNRIQVSGAALAGVTAKLAADASVKNNKVHLKASAGVALALGLEGAVDVVIDFTPLLEEERTHRVVPGRNPGGTLIIQAAR